MSYLGNLDGPPRSAIIEALGHEYFGISPEELADEIEFERDGELRGLIAPVHVDEDGEPYLVLSRPGGSERYYLHANGYSLTGDIRTYAEPEQEYWYRAQRRDSKE